MQQPSEGVLKLPCVDKEYLGLQSIGIHKQASPQPSHQDEAWAGWSKDQTVPILLTAWVLSVTTHQPGTAWGLPVFSAVVLFSCPLCRPAFSAVLRSVFWRQGETHCRMWLKSDLTILSCFQMTLLKELAEHTHKTPQIAHYTAFEGSYESIYHKS